MAFIVLEGLDGAGKSTQIEMLKDLLTAEGNECEFLHFPRFDSPVFGDMIARFLRGELGGVDEVNPYVVALLFAGDRGDAGAQIQQWLDEGKSVILDRYVYSNIGYQCAKLDSAEKREELRQWILSTEFEYFGIPCPDLSLFLDVPLSFIENKLAEQRDGDDRDYLKGQKDIYEQSWTFRVECERSISIVRRKIVRCKLSIVRKRGVWRHRR